MVTKPNGGIEAGIDEPANVNGGTEWPDTIEATDDDGIPVIEPETVSSPTSGSEPARKRGRPRGSKGASNKTRKESSNDLGTLLYGLHFMLSNITPIKELELSEHEAKRLGDALQKVNEFYGGIVVPEWAQVWGQFGMAAAAVYGPRAIAYSNRMRAEKNMDDVKRGKPVVGVVVN